MLENASNLANANSYVEALRGFWFFLSDYWQELSALAAIITIILVVIGLFFKRYLQKKQHAHEKEMEGLRQEYEEKLRQRDIQVLTGHVVDGLNDFTTSWFSFLKQQPQSIISFSEIAVMPILKKVANIREIVMSGQGILSETHFKALKIADDIESIIKWLESPKGWDTNERFVRKEEINVLAERARECVRELGEKNPMANGDNMLRF